ncbi:MULTISPECIES: NAD(P)H-dependent oxidoreductase [unclassified Leptolyngbya]|uniref:NADPH-dependent FMN reductase n=1 Tax=unclassified Leptolyngbya TaxID=2650499 RepID=UPI0016842A23|nr:MULTISPECIES: NAD(P)H-dependent oxidoreductase [unclassified Leptolyngbya]MBD1911944.1 NAD(P)H-dependent oxidoreductase [Leptolyngbya sp. FACHB-8]MBD2154245.1 NAD(P)H-dependent oxidoreductase [Leptolyngbya sp. FACHB-16]
MSDTPRILAFSGSARKESLNKRLVQIAANGARTAGAEVTYLDFRDLPLPLYDEDLEKERGIPENVFKLKELMKSHQGFLISSPEYNSSVTPLLKNAIDWASRPTDGEPPLSLTAFTDKVAGLMSASPGGLGGLRGLIHLRSILGNIRVLVLPDQVAVTKAYEAFNPDGTLKDPQQQKLVEEIGVKVATVAAKLNG